MSSEFNQSPWIFSRVPGGYESKCPTLGITITADDIKRKSDELIALLCVRSTMVGLRTVEDDILKTGTLNFYAQTSRVTWVKSLRAACPGEAQSLDWETYLERFVNQVIKSERLGDPLIELSDVELSEANRYLIPGLVSAEETTIWFGDGGSMKSYLALAAGATISMGNSDYLGVDPNERRKVGYVDWEWGAQAHRRRLGRLAGNGVMPKMSYIRCDRPLTHEVPRLQRLVHENNLGFLILDSIVFGCDGPAENSDTAGRYIMAVRQLGVPCLLIAHVTKAEDGDKKPFGSAFWANSARLTWFIKKSGEYGDQAMIGMFNRKNNDDKNLDPRAFRFWFQDDLLRTVISPASTDEIANEPEIADRLPVRDRIIAAVRHEPKTMVQIAEEIGKSVESVATTIRRDEAKGRTFTRIVGEDRVYRITLLPTGTDD